MHSEAPFARLRGGLSIFIFIALAIALSVYMAPNVSSRLVSFGEMIWPGYAENLRTDPERPVCSIGEEEFTLEQLQAQVAQCPVTSLPKKKNTNNKDTEEDLFADDNEEDLFADPPEKEEDLFADDKEDDLFADDSDEDLFAGEEGDKETVTSSLKKPKPEECPALRNLTKSCEDRNAKYNEISAKITDGVLWYRSIETTLGSVAKFPYWKHLLVLLTLLGAMCVTAARAHIALREAKTVLEYRLAQGTQLLVHLFWLVSCWNDYQTQINSTATKEHVEIPILWAVGFALLGAVNLFHLLKPPGLEETKISIGRLLMVIPLYVYMGIIAAIWFTFGEGHSSGQAIYLHKYIQHPTIYLGIGLYIWAGMLFATTRIAKIFFGLLTPWGLPIGLLAWLTVVLAAVPTAYSGASGIFVIAAGAVIFDQLTKAGASKRMALAATAMSGSLGVVLRPCLVVVLVAVLNKQVTTDQLFSKGLLVFILTSVLLLVAMLWRNTEPLKLNPVPDAKARALDAAKKLSPYILLAVVVVFSYGFILDTWINEHTAPAILPGVLLLIVIVERLYIRKSFPEEADQRRLWSTLIEATKESSTHIGALLMVMAASVGLGGVVERAEVMSYFPDDFGGPIGTMGALVFIMVLVGMTMDALGAVVLVSVTLAKVAYDNGIDPVHFWMMVLVAFELGYLTPPVAINHLLARQVIGPDANVEEDGTIGFWNRTEHIWLPMLVMSIALLIVAFVPFYWYEA